MSDPSKDGEVNVPPIKLPEPDPFDTNKGGDTSKRGKKGKDKKKYRHPLDSQKDVRREKKGGCCGAIGCFALILILLFVGLIAAPGYILFKDFANGYTVVQLEGVEEVISTAPSEPTLYVNPQGRIIYNAPETAVSIGIAAQEVEVDGVFADRLLIRGSKVTCKGTAHCQSDLNVYAIQFIDEGIRVDGVKQGKTLQ